jgi:hypothetical protein
MTQPTQTTSSEPQQTGTRPPWLVEVWPTQYPDLHEYHVVAPEGYVDERGQAQRCGVAVLDSAPDARLIAEAPELLRAVRGAVEWLDNLERAGIPVVEYMPNSVPGRPTMRNILARVDGTYQP